MLSFVLALCAVIIAFMNGTGRGIRIPLWVAVALLALAMIIPRLALMTL
jgi:hypothetical protein